MCLVVLKNSPPIASIIWFCPLSLLNEPPPISGFPCLNGIAPLGSSRFILAHLDVILAPLVSGLPLPKGIVTFERFRGTWGISTFAPQGPKRIFKYRFPYGEKNTFGKSCENAFFYTFQYIACRFGNKAHCEDMPLLRSSRDHLGGFLATSWLILVHLGSSWHHFESFCVPLGSSWDHYESS